MGAAWARELGGRVTSESGLSVRIERDPPAHLLPFERFFRGFADLPPVRELFGRQTRTVLRNLKVEFFASKFGYMGTSDVDGHLLISTHHLKTGEFRVLYLDLYHELCHVRQFRQGKPLFYPRLDYVDAPSEIDAYRKTIAEGRRIGMTDRELVDYLRMDWLDAREHRRLARRMGLKVPARRRRAARNRR